MRLAEAFIQTTYSACTIYELTTNIYEWMNHSDLYDSQIQLTNTNILIIWALWFPQCGKEDRIV